MKKIVISLCCIVCCLFSYTFPVFAELALPDFDIYDINNYIGLPYSTITQARVYYDNNGSAAYKDANYNQQTGIFYTYTENIGFNLDQVQYRFRMNTTDYLSLSSNSIYCITFNGQEFTQLISFEALTSEMGNNTTSYTNFELFLLEDNTYQLFFIPESDIQVYYLNLYFNCDSETLYLHNINYPAQGYTLYELTLTDEIINNINTSNRFKSIENKIDEVNDTLINGDSSTSDTVSEADNVLDDFNTEIDQYQDLENSLQSQFVDALAPINNIVNDFSFNGSLLATSAFISNQMSSIYSSMGDYSIYFTYPLLLGIALLIIGRSTR